MANRNNNAFYAQRLEDLQFMAETGESAVGAAQRLGLAYTTLEAWAHNHAPAIWRRMTARNPVNPTSVNAGNQYTAA